MKRQRTGSVVCPSCGRLVGVNDERCYNCGRPRPGMWGLTPWLRSLAGELGLDALVIGGCTVLYVIALALKPSGIQFDGLFRFLSPAGEANFRLGMSGYVPVVQVDRWWTVLSAGWLHGGLLHIGFNMMWIRSLAPAVEQLYGLGRGLIVYTVASVGGFLLSSVSPVFPAPLVWLMSAGAGPAGYTLGSSAALFGLLGALVHYSRRGGIRGLGQQVWGWAIALFIFGFIFPGVDNWAHLGGFLGGWGISWALDPLKQERLDHLLIGFACLVATAVAVVWSFVSSRGMIP